MLRLSKVGLAPPHSFLGAPAVLDIDTRYKPLNNLSVLVAQGHCAVQQPAIFPITPPRSGFNPGRFSGSQRPTPFVHHVSRVLGVNYAGSTPTANLLSRARQVFQPSPI